MKKRLFGVLLALVVCLLALCVTAGAASDTQQESSIIRIDDQWPDGSPYVKYVDSFDEAITWMMKGSTFTLLKDVKLDKQLTLTAVQLSDKPFYLDLDGHTLSGELDDQPLILISPPTVSEVKFWNGTVRNDGSGAAMRLEDGMVMLQDLNVTGDVVLKGSFYSSTGNYIPTFRGGGTFSKIYVEDREVNLSIILGRGCYLTDANGQRVDANNNYDVLENVTVHACTHKDETGRYTFERNNQGDYVCTICGNECLHEDRTQDDLQCKACGQQLRVLVTYKNQYKEPRYFRTFDEATGIVVQRADMLRLLCDQESHSFYIQGFEYDIDLNGCTLTAVSGSSGGQAPVLTLRSQTIRFINTAEGTAHYAGTIIIGEPGSTATLKVPAENNDLLFDELIFRYGRSQLSGGTYGSIKVENDITLQSLLGDSCYFSSVDNDLPLDLTGLTELANVKVRTCDHKTNYQDGHCYCGKVTYTARHEVAGQPVTYYASLADAAAAADGGVGVLKPCAAITGDVTISQDVTIDTELGDYLAGAALTVSGTVRLTNSSEQQRTVGSVRVSSGGKLTVGDAALRIGTLTVETGGAVELADGSSYGSVVLEGEAAFADFEALLPEGKTFRKANGAWANDDDLTDAEGGKALADVSVQTTPITITVQPEDKTMTAGETSGLPEIAFASHATYDAAQETTLTWYYTLDGDTTAVSAESPVFTEGAAAAAADFLDTLGAGTYECHAVLRHNGYILRSADFTVTVNAKPAPEKPNTGSVAVAPVRNVDAPASGTRFADVSETDYYYEAVCWADENDIADGVGGERFAPEMSCTRAQLITMLWRLAGEPSVKEDAGFSDTDGGAYYAAALRWAVQEGIIAGYGGGTFGPNDAITRGQMAMILYRWAKAQGKGFTGAWMFLLPFGDVDGDVYEAVAWCYMNGITKGTSAETFSPNETCTRAQIVTFLYRMAQALQ